MNLVIDASNIRQGGGVTHLQEVLNAADFDKYGFNKVTVWAPQSTLERIGDIPNLVRKTHPLINKGGIFTRWFQFYELDRQINSDVALLWVPGGMCLSSFRPYVTMVQNFLPFVKVERDRFKFSKSWFRFIYLGYAQTKSFQNAEGLIHISHKTYEVINAQVNLKGVQQVTIHHGLNPRFHLAPREQRDFIEFTKENPARLLYVSDLSCYKHQDKLIEAVAMLRAKGIQIHLDLVGAAMNGGIELFENAKRKSDPNGEWVHWHGSVSYEEVMTFYHDADLYACMSSCETFGMILLEAMASGLPILCSNKSALPEIQGGSCSEVDPEDVEAVAAGLERMIRDKFLREKCASDAYERAQTFSWNKCADATFEFLAKCALSDSN